MSADFIQPCEQCFSTLPILIILFSSNTDFNTKLEITQADPTTVKVYNWLLLYDYSFWSPKNVN